MTGTEPNLAALACQLRSTDSTVSAAAETALDALFRERGAEAALIALVDLLAHADWHVRDAALLAILHLTRLQDAGILPRALARTMAGNMMLEEVLLLAGVRVIHPDSRRAQRQILRLLGHENPWVRRKAARSLGELGSQVGTRRVVAAIARLLRDGDGRVRRAAALALAAIGRPAARRRVLAGIARLLGDRDEAVQYDAAVAIARFGRLAATCPVLCGLAALHDPGRGGDQWFAGRSAVRSMGSAAAVPRFLRRLARMLPGEDRGTQAYHLCLLAEMGPPAATKAVLGSIADILRRGRADGGFPGSVFDAVAAMGAAAGKHEPLVKELTLVAEGAPEHDADDARAVLLRFGLSLAGGPDPQASAGLL